MSITRYGTGSTADFFLNGQPEVRPGRRSGDAAAWGAREVARPDQEGLGHHLNRLGLLADRHGERRGQQPGVRATV